MSKKRIFNKKLRKGRFYLTHDGSEGGHPSMIYWKSDKHNLYLSLTTGTSYNKDLIRLKVPTDSITKKSYVNKRPFLGKRKDFGNKELSDMKFSKIDKRLILRIISKHGPRFSSSLSRKDKRLFIKLRRRKRIMY